MKDTNLQSLMQDLIGLGLTNVKGVLWNLNRAELVMEAVKNGEGVYGLQRSFLVSGAQSLIISFWKVDDKATNHFMSVFYKKYLKSGDKEEAFKLAMLSTKQKYEHPYYWAAFSMMR